MYPMVQQQRQESRQQNQDVETDPEEQDIPSALRRRSRRPFYRRFFSYVKEAWTGVKFALG